MRLGLYAGASTAAAAGCLLQAFHQRPNFYSATVYLSQSNACLLILTNLILVLACGFLFGLQRLLYGRLRPIEIEQLSEKAWYAVLDTLLAIPNFREDVGGWLLTMFVLLIAGKVWGWIGEGRVDILEQQPPANPRLFHARLSASLIISVLFDVFMVKFCVETVMADPRPGMMVIFTFEFAILTIFSTFTLLRYVLDLVQANIEKKQMEAALETRKIEIQAERQEQRRQYEATKDSETPASAPEEGPIEVDENEVDVPGWDAKRRWLFGLEVVTDFLKLVIYIVFFTVSITFNGLPMHIMRDVYMTFASFSKRVSDYVAYRQATSDMNTRYPDATTEEIRGDACIVCREAMVAWGQPTDVQGQGQPAAPAPARRDEGLRAKKLPCGHILHLRCLKAWLERQQVCPTCRRPVIAAQPAAPGQPGIPGAGAAPAQQGQQGQAPRPNRARFFNLGPVRIGFLNGPPGQIQNLVNQMRNQNAAQGQEGAVAGALPAHQQGPNHLGLQVPYLNGAAQQQGPTLPAAGATAAVPTQIQLMQIEQRLLREAHNLGIEQQQLSTLRMMEGELARLRAGHLPANQPVGTATAAQRHQPLSVPGLTGFGATPFQPQMPEVLQGNHSQQLANGAEGLPQGLTLPEGWTIMPLHRAGETASLPPQVNVQSADGQTVQPPVQSTTNGTSAASTGQLRQGDAANGGFGPTDDAGSPLFVPTARSASDSSTTATTRPAPSPATELPSEQQAQEPAARVPSQPDGETRPPWAINGDWNFVGQNGDSASNGHPPSPTADTARLSEGVSADTEQQSYSGKGKGKGRAVEIEDAQDESKS
ncbi:RING-H2 zinc finger protein domain [Teratosphaeria destructans]|uniref:RING-type E3 ubiquitin transferase n=1 Tax=Teratosphaeria destructans TaxID=418781 RepID=A0A9W7SSP2_9PEZI|nr:RING-H2 zinc finger protein domain [Teratosphaeria destructans]